MDANVRFGAIDIRVNDDVSVAGRVCTPEWWPSGQRVGVVIGHDVDTTMDADAIAGLQSALAERGHLVLAFNFPYAQARKKRPDAPELLERTYRAATNALLLDAENAPARLVLAGYGLGARVATQIVAAGMKVEGIVCLGFPLHPSGKPNQQKADALFRVIAPMLFIQGARDPHCRIDRLTALLKTVGAPTRLRVIEDCGQGLNLIRRSERTPEQVRTDIAQSVEAFIQKVI
jgi:predicted alpha/beta-hydrolase family hydrolase